MSVLRIPTTAVGTMPLVQIPRDRSAALVVLDSPEMDTTVKVMKIIKAWCSVVQYIIHSDLLIYNTTYIIT